MSSTSMPLLPPGAATSSLGRWRGRSKGLTRRRREKQIAMNSFNHPRQKKENVTVEPIARTKIVSTQRIQPAISDRCFQVLNEILAKLIKKDSNQIFAYPVDGSIVTDYHDIIKNPMDFRTMREKISRRDYKYFESFEVDVQLIINNCYLYNAPSTVFYKAARNIEECWRKWRDRFYVRFLSASESIAEASGRHDIAVSSQREVLPDSGGWRMRRTRGGASRGVIRSNVRQNRHIFGTEDLSSMMQGSPSEASQSLKTSGTSQIYNTIPSESCQESTANEIMKDSPAISTQHGPSLNALLSHPEGKNYVERALNVVSSPEAFLCNIFMDRPSQQSELKSAETIGNSLTAIMGASNAEVSLASDVGTTTKSTDFLREYCHALMSTATEASMNEMSSLSSTASLVACTSKAPSINPFKFAAALNKSPSRLNCASILNTSAHLSEASSEPHEAMQYFQSIRAFIGKSNFDKLERLYPQGIAALHVNCSSSPLPPVSFNDLRLFGIDTGEVPSLNTHFTPSVSGNTALLGAVPEHSLLGVGENNIRSALSFQKGANKINMRALESLAEKYRSRLTTPESIEPGPNREYYRNQGEVNSSIPNLLPLRPSFETASQAMYTQRVLPFHTRIDSSGLKYIEPIRRQDDTGTLPQYAPHSMSSSLPPYSISEPAYNNADFYSGQGTRQWQDTQRNTPYLDVASSLLRNSSSVHSDVSR